MATPTPLRDKLSINPEDQMMDVADTPAALRNYQHQVSRVEFLSFYYSSLLGQPSCSAKKKQQKYKLV